MFLDVSCLAERRSTPPICAGSSVKMLTSKEKATLELEFTDMTTACTL